MSTLLDDNAQSSRPDDAWIAAMRRGDLCSAWAICDAVLRQRRQAGVQCHSWPRHLQYIWTGASLDDKRVLVRCYHGLGDSIQFIRFAAPLRRLAREVIVWAQPALLRLIAAASGVDRAMPLDDGGPRVEFDVDIEIMELPHALRATLSTLPRPPYLSPAWQGQRRCHQVPRVGIVWQAGDWDPRRSVPIRLIAELAVPGVELCSLQRGPERRCMAGPCAADLGTDDVHELAARMAELDLVISVDTMAAHLAGAIGAPVWTLLCADCDWRWMEHRHDSPWYPTMRLFRQPRPGEWGPVIEAVRAALAELAAAFASRHRA